MADIPKVGEEFTVTTWVAVVVQPVPSVPITVYVCVEPGVTVILDVVAPVLHEYPVEVPVAFIVAVVPAHLVLDGNTFVLTVGPGSAVTAETAIAEHPLASYPVTVYEAVVAPTVIVDVVAPVLHLYVNPPPAVSVAPAELAHTVVAVGATVTGGISGVQVAQFVFCQYKPQNIKE